MKQGVREALASREAADLSTGKMTVSVKRLLLLLQGSLLPGTRGALTIESGVAEVQFGDMGKSQAVVLQEPECLRLGEH